MMNTIQNLTLAIILVPLMGAMIAGLFGKKIGKAASHIVTILGVGASFIGALWLAKIFMINGHAPVNFNLYTWGESGSFNFNVGFLIDHLTIFMMCIVTFVSLLVHIYSIGYMKGDPGYQRFFCYMSLFTFGMLSLVSANNFMLLFFGWEAVGVVSYLLIGFWFKKDSAAAGSYKAFMVNRVGDFGFLLGIAAILDTFGSVDYAQVLSQAPQFTNALMTIWPFHAPMHTISVICVLLFVGAMGKSAQIPLHIWLPESMEGPTPISALIHAATMVTAGIFMVARMSPLFNLSPAALSFVMIIGATGALFLGLLAVVENDIKRIVAYSTMSQLGYMMAANGAGAYSAGIFHLGTHAFFKALLFLGAGSVIIAMHHEQDIRKMGNLKKYMPITYVTYLIGSLALVAIPPFAGFYSKDAIIEAVAMTNIPGSAIAYWFLLIGAYVTALYTFRSFFLTFHTEERLSDDAKKHVKESPLVVTLPLILLAIPSVIIGAILVGPMLFAKTPLLSDAIKVLPQLDVLGELAKEYHGVVSFTLHGLMGLPFLFTVAGIFTAWLCYIKKPELPAVMAKRFAPLRNILLNSYGFDAFNNIVFVKGTQKLSNVLFRYGDAKLIDDWIVNGSGRGVNRVANIVKRLQTGYLYHYAFAMILGVFALLIWLLLS